MTSERLAGQTIRLTADDASSTCLQGLDAHAHECIHSIVQVRGVIRQMPPSRRGALKERSPEPGDRGAEGSRAADQENR